MKRTKKETQKQNYLTNKIHRTVEKNLPTKQTRPSYYIPFLPTDRPDSLLLLAKK